MRATKTLFMAKSRLLEYKFKSIYRFVDIVYETIEKGVDYLDFDFDQFVVSASKFNEKSLLHIFAENILFNHFHIEFYETGDSLEDDCIDWWIELMNEYKIKLTDDMFNSDLDNPFYHWYTANEDVFKKFFGAISNEVVHILFNDKQFLVKFNKHVRNMIKDDSFSANYLIWPEGSRKNDGTIIRRDIPQWVKDAVFHRDKGRCVFCNKNLTCLIDNIDRKHYDHIIPLKDYGTNDPCNIQLTCENCNKRKGAQDKVPDYKYPSWW